MNITELGKFVGDAIREEAYRKNNKVEPKHYVKVQSTLKMIKDRVDIIVRNTTENNKHMTKIEDRVRDLSRWGFSVLPEKKTKEKDETHTSGLLP